MIIVSACLCGIDCKYNGGNNKNEKVIEFLKDKEYRMICPEEMGGLPTPRIPSEEVFASDGTMKVMSKEGKDVTAEFIKGAEFSLKVAKECDAELAILKARSPSCGKGIIYDGTFSGNLTEGNGVTADLFIKSGIKVLSENDFE
ncbi:DUF523 domain-containing protein [Clostridium sp.]|uniref:DUF523 domain-containing protein n=1 Tax=Clostridium sp. TaxID=1506 RepID=UPI003994221B